MIILSPAETQTETFTCKELEIRYNQLTQKYNETYLKKQFFIGAFGTTAFLLFAVILVWVAEKEHQKRRRANR